MSAFLLWKCRFSKPRKILVFMSTQDMVDFHHELLDRCLNNNHQEEDEEEEKEDYDENTKEMIEKMNMVVDAGKKQEKKKNVSTIKQQQKQQLKLFKLHGSMDQKDRLKILERIKSAEDCVLFCTDVAARGLDLPQVDWIVQYNPPTTTADYVHRVGRTARIGTKGSSLILVLPSEADFIKELERNNMPMVEMTAERVLEKLYANAEPSKKTGGLPHTMEEAATDLQMNFENAIANDKGLHELASQAYVSLIRSYASYPREVRHIFSFKALHLGHIAKSFGLRDPPSHITGIGKGHWVKKEAQKKKDLRKEQTIIKAQEKRINQKSLVMSEFSSGFDGINFDKKIHQQKKQNKKQQR